jgi:hypothetical protein
LHIGDIDGVEHIEQRRRQSFGLRLVEPRADHERRLRRNQSDFEFVGRNALDIAQAGCGEGGVHAGKAGADDD